MRVAEAGWIHCGSGSKSVGRVSCSAPVPRWCHSIRWQRAVALTPQPRTQVFINSNSVVAVHHNVSFEANTAAFFSKGISMGEGGAVSPTPSPFPCTVAVLHSARLFASNVFICRGSWPRLVERGAARVPISPGVVFELIAIWPTKITTDRFY